MHPLFNPTLPFYRAGEVDVKNLTKDQEADESQFKTPEGELLEVQEKISLLEWLANNYKKFGCVLEFITNKSQEGSQFCRGFGGVGGLLRYSVDVTEFEGPEPEDNEDWDSDEYI